MVSRDRVFQIVFSAACISPKTPEAVAISMAIPTMVATIPDDLVEALAITDCRTSAACSPSAR